MPYIYLQEDAGTWNGSVTMENALRKNGSVMNLGIAKMGVMKSLVADGCNGHDDRSAAND